MLAKLNHAVALGALRSVDVGFATHLNALVKNTTPEVLLAAALVSQRIGEGDVCLNLEQCAYAPIFKIDDADYYITVPSFSTWHKILTTSPLVGKPGQRVPLILDGKRLYLERYWQFEQNLTKTLESRLGCWNQNVDLGLLAAGITHLFPLDVIGLPEDDPVDWQRIAAAMAVLRPFCVISGGPGTGKTHTVTAILSLLIEQAQAQTPKYMPRIALGVPTGKAAARLTESIRERKSGEHKLPIEPHILAMLPDQASTLHRLLGFRRGKSEPSYGTAKKLPLDILVIDEASMLDLPMMARVLAALPASARLILLGDRNQLASVEAGMVLSDLCGRGADYGYSSELLAILAKVTSPVPTPTTTTVPTIADHQVVLRKSRRFGNTSGIGNLAKAVNAGMGAKALEILVDNHNYPDVKLFTGGLAALIELLRQRIVPVYRQIFAASNEQDALKAFNTLRILCAVREGPFGVNAINRYVENILLQSGLIKGDSVMYAGRPLLITANDHSQRLFNGDVGLILQDFTDKSTVRAFIDTQDGVRQFAPTKIPAHETVYAMTVHKSQGSEFNGVILVLPNMLNRVVTRELVYTGITRAKEEVTIVAEPELLTQAIGQVMTRSSGLFERLWQSKA